MARLAVLLLAALFLMGFAYLTLSAVSSQGFTLAGALSIFILVLLAVGIVGAILNPPRR
ncbi:MAG TPA: hypothetical protein VMG62_02865 [Solirubrobacteraceae bacterium]|nr:hypothetical protein [Solirubrobacteraceae bacterium]